MSLSNFTQAPTQSVFSNISSAQATQQPQGDASSVPGTRSGPAPAQNPVNQENWGAAPASSPSGSGGAVDNPLAEYARKADDGNTAQGNKSQQLNIKPEVFQQLASTVSQQVKPNSEMVEAALRGDSEAMNNLLGDFGKQLIQQTLMASTVTANNLQQSQSEQVANQVTERTAQSQARKDAIQVATGSDSRLTDPNVKQFVEFQVDKLREQYPTAPAELLGQEAARLVGETLGPAPTKEQETDSGMDWLAHTRDFEQL